MTQVDPGGVISIKTNNTYATVFESLLSGERLHDLELSWQFDPGKAKPHGDLDELYDNRLVSIDKKYDFLELSWGAGYDSSYLLEVSLRNNIPFDMISMVGYDNIKDPHTVNLELKNNYAHITRYLARFPDTAIRFIDLRQLWGLAREDAQRKDWSRCYPTLDNICGLYSDALLERRPEQNRCLITGNGWKNIAYNSEHRTWSMYHTSSSQYTHVAHTDVCDLVPFFGTHDIVMSSCLKAMAVAGDRQGIWCPSSTWMQKNVLYREMASPIWRFPENDGVEHGFSSAEVDWFCKDHTPTDPETHEVYWDWIDDCNSRIHKEDLGGRLLPAGFHVDKIKVIDFHTG